MCVSGETGQFLERTQPVRRRVGLRALISGLIAVVSMSFMALPVAAAVEGRMQAVGISAATYNQVVLADRPVGFWTSNVDLTGHGRNGTFSGGPTVAVMPNGDHAPRYDGARQYLTIPDDRDWSVTRTGSLTVEAWLRPDTLQFPHDEGFHKEYVHWLGKGRPGNQEYVARMYSLRNFPQRPNRISGYAFNPAGGLGAGSYFQDRVRGGEWIHYALVINIKNVSSKYPTGYTKIYKNGQLRDQDALIDYSIVPRDGTAPLRVATQDLGSFFKGAIGKVAVYNRELTGAQLVKHYRAMVPA